MQLPFAFLTFVHLESTHFTAVPTFSLECPFAVNGREMYLFVTGMSFIPTSSESMYLGNTTAQFVEIGTVGLQLVQYQCAYDVP